MRPASVSDPAALLFDLLGDGTPDGSMTLSVTCVHGYWTISIFSTDLADGLTSHFGHGMSVAEAFADLSDVRLRRAMTADEIEALLPAQPQKPAPPRLQVISGGAPLPEPSR